MGQSTYIRDGFVSAGNAQVTGSLGVTGGITGSLLGTATSATLAADSDRLGGVGAASYALNSAFTSFATTGSNTFVGNQTITGSITITQNLTVLGSSSIQYITSSQLNIANNLISVNTNNPGVRFGGLAVIDSGSSPQRSGSLLFDSQENQWVFVHQNNAGAVTSSVLIMGPQTYNNIGSEVNLTTNRLPKSTNAEHIGDSNISDTGTEVSINSNTQITGSAIITGSLNVIGNTTITGSLNITGSSTITNGALILSSSAGSAIILRTAGDSVYMLDNYGATGRSYLRIGTTGIAIHNAGADPTITCAIGMNINSAATIYSSATSHIFYGGTNKQVSIGTAAVPTAKLHIAAGAAAATSAPIKLTAGTNMTTPEAGAIEFDGANLFFTTGSTRQIAVAATSALTSSRIPFATTNGRLTDSSKLTYGATADTLHVEGSSGNTLFELTRAGEITYKYNIDSSNTLNITTTTGDTSYYFLRGNKFGIGINATARLHVVGGTATANTAPIKFTAGTNLTTPEAGTIEFDGNSLFFTTGSTRSTILTNTNPASITGNLVVTGSLLVSGSVRLNGNAGVNITGNTQITGSLLLSGSSLVAGITPIPLAGTIKDGVTSVLGSLNDWNSNYYQGDVLYSETAGGTITFGQLCYRTNTETWALADASVFGAASTYMLGICVKSSTSTNPTSILINGFVETATYAAILKTGEPLYMTTTAGSMSKSAPTASGNIVRIIGHTFWDSNTNSKIIIRFNPESSWIELT
jgi:hypothetical protein